jgi:hypothetical protein
MKSLKFTILSFVFALTVAACSKSSKDDTPPAPTSLDGIWIGKSVTDADKSTAFYSFDIKPNGVLNRLDESGAIVGTGIWSIDNNIFQGTYKNASNAKFSVLGSYNKGVAKILGNWGYNNSVTNGGTWEMARKK